MLSKVIVMLNREEVAGQTAVENHGVDYRNEREQTLAQLHAQNFYLAFFGYGKAFDCVKDCKPEYSHETSYIWLPENSQY